MDKDDYYERNDSYEPAICKEKTRGVSASASNDLLPTIKAIRASDCGAWLKDCHTGLFRCSDGHEKRLELSMLLDRLYKAAGI